MIRRAALLSTLAILLCAGLSSEPPCSPAKIDRIYRRNGWQDDAFRLSYGIYLVDSQGGNSYYDGSSTFYYKGTPSIVFYKGEVSNLEWYGGNATLFRNGIANAVFGVDESSNRDYSRSLPVDGASRAVLDCYFFEWGWKLHCSLDLLLALDEQPPEMVPMDFRWHRGPVSLGFPSTKDQGVGLKPDSYFYAMAGGSRIAVSDPSRFSYAFDAEGVHELRFFASDRLDNNAELSAKLGIDWTPPELEPFSDAPFTRWSNKASVLVGCTVKDTLSGPLGATASVDNGAWVSLSSPIAIRKEGKSLIRVRGSDVAGNEASTTREIWLDRGLPEIRSLFPLGSTESNATIRSSQTFSASAKDALSGIDTESLAHRIGDGPTSRGWPAILPEGRYRLELTCKDIAGNQASLSGWVCVDKGPPELIVSVSPVFSAGVYSNASSLSISARCEDSVSGLANLEYSLDEGPFMPYEASIVVSKEGTTQALFRAWDRAGNEITKSIDILLDRQSPSISTQPTLGLSEAHAAMLRNGFFTAQASDGLSGIHPESIMHRIGEGPWVPGFPSLLPEGKWRISLSCADLAGNERLEEGWFCVDIESPRGRILPSAGLLPSSWSAMGDAIVRIEAFDALSGIDLDASYASLLVYGEEERRIPFDEPIVLVEGTNAISYVIRDKAGNAEAASALFLIDRSGPAISRATIESYNNRDSISFSLEGAYDAGIGLLGARVEYALAANEEAPASWSTGPLVSFFPTDFETSVAGLPEGPMSLHVRLRDALGNTGRSICLAFGIDRTPPSLNDLSLHDAGLRTDVGLDTSVPIAADSFRIHCEAFDSGALASGLSHSFYGRGRDPVSALDDLNRGGILFDSLTCVDAGSEGAHWLAITFSDRSGNRSEPSLLSYRVNRAIPASPYIRSSSHELASSDANASSLDRATFNVIARGDAATKSYEWFLVRKRFSDHDSRLDELYREALRSGSFAVEALSASITLEAVPANVIGESWLFVLRGVSPSGVCGPWASYPFKVDPDMPGGFELKAPSLIHLSNGTTYAPTGGFMVEWPAPEDDGSGIKGYVWRLASFDEHGEVRERGATRSLPSHTRSIMIPSLPSGAYKLVVVAVDFSGNEREVELDFISDAEAPKIEGDILMTTEALDGSEFVAIRARFPEAHDEASGLVSCGWRLSVSGGRSLAFGPRPENGDGFLELAFVSLEEPCVLEFMAIDAAGNRACQSLAFIAEVPHRADSSVRLERYELESHGFSLQGAIARTDWGYEASDRSELAVVLPSCMSARVGDVPVDRIEFDSIEIVSAGPFMASRGFKETEPLSLSSSSGLFVCSGISFARETGITINDVLSTRILDATETPLRFNWIRLEGAPIFTASASSRIEGPLSLGTMPFPMEGLQGLRYEESGLRADSAQIDLGQGSFGLLEDGAPVRYLEARDLVLDEHGTLIEASVGDGLRFNWGSLEILVGKARVKGSAIIVDRGICMLPPGASPPSVPIGGITLDPDGTARALRSFAMGSFSLRLAGREYHASPLMGADEALLFSLESDEAGAPPIIGALSLATRVAPEAKCGPFTFALGDFSLEATDAVALSDGILIIEARLMDEPSSLPGSSGAIFEGLKLENDSLRSEGPGRASRPLAVSLPYNARGGKLWLYEASISSVGICGRLEFPTPFGDDARLAFSGTSFDAKGKCTLPSSICMAGGALHGFPVTIRASLVDQARFEGSVCLDSRLPGLESIDLLASWDGGGFIDEPRSAIGIRFEAQGIAFELESLQSSAAGIGGRSFASAGAARLEFPLFRLLPGGSYSPGKGSGTLIMGSYLLRLDEVIIDGDRIEALSAAIELPSFSGVTRLELHPFMFEACREAELILHGSGEASYVDVTGFCVNPRTWTLDSHALKASGTLCLPPAFSSAFFDCPDGFVIDPDGYPRTEKPIPNLTFMAHGMRCEGFKGSIEGGTARFESIRVNAGSFSASLVAASLDTASGSVLCNDPIEVELAGFIVSCSSVSIGEGGIVGSGMLHLPKALGIDPIWMEAFGLDSSGSLFADLSFPTIRASGEAWSLEIESMRLGRAGLSATRVVFGFVMGGEKIRAGLERVMILPDGGIASGTLSINPFMAGGFEISLSSLYFGQEGVLASGSLRLPLDLPGDASGLLISLDDILISRAGMLESFNLILDKRFSLPLDTSGLTIFCANPSLTYSEGRFYLAMAKAGLELPPSLGGAAIACEGLSLDLATGAFDFSAFSIEETQIAFGEASLTLSRLAIDRSGGLSFSGFLDLPQGLPSSISAKRLSVNELLLGASGSIERLSASLSGIAGPFCEGLELVDGAISAHYGTGESLGLSLSGRIVARGESLPEWLKGASLEILDCQILPCEGRLASLRARAEGLRIELGGIGTLEGLALSIDTQDFVEGLKLGARATLVLGGACPDGLRSARIPFAMEVDSARGITQVEAGIALNGRYELGKALYLIDPAFSVSLNAESRLSIKAKAGLELGETMPEGLKGLKASLDRFVIDDRGRIEDIAASLSLIDGPLFKGVETRGARISLGIRNGSPVFSLKGDLVLGSALGGIGSIDVRCELLEIGLDGTILGISAGCAVNNLPIADGLMITQGSIVAGLGENEIIVSCEGLLALEAPFPQSLRSARLKLKGASFSTRRGFLSFSAGLESPLEWKPFDGLALSIDALDVGNEGVTLGARARLCSPLPEGLDGLAIGIKRLRVDWKGRISAFDAGVLEARASLWGFKLGLKDLLIDSQGIKAAKAWIDLPQEFGGASLAFSQAGFTWAGTFYGNPEASEIRADISGFSLALKGPERSGERIRFREASLVMPEVLGKAQISLIGPSISPRGLELDGAEFSLPGFMIGDGVGFSGILVKFARRGNSWSIEGNSACFIPGIGNVRAELAFVTADPSYPIGLKRAYLEYEATGFGIALGSSGLSITGLRGLFEYGPPGSTIPPELKPFLANSKGPRMQLGISLVDIASGGGLARFKIDAWVDVHELVFAIKGDASIANGLIQASALAVFSRNCFAADLFFSISLIEGRVSAYFFERGGNSYFSGRASLTVKIPQGIIFGFLPFTELRLPNIGAEFGSFLQDGRERRGASFFVEIPIAGRIGGFYSFDTGRLEFPDLARLRLVTPFASNEALAPRLASMGSKPSTFLLRVEGARRLIVLSDRPADTLELISPDGAVYKEGSGGLESTRSASGCAISLESPVNGLWKLVRYSGGEEGLVAIGACQLPVASLEERGLPNVARAPFTARARLAGGEGISAKLYLVPSFSNGTDPLLCPMERLIGENVADSQGWLEFRIDPTAIQDGSYLLELRPVEACAFEALRGTRVISMRAAFPLRAPSNFSVSRDGARGIRFSFDHIEGGRAESYELAWANGVAQGNVKLGQSVKGSLALPEEAIGAYFRVRAIDGANRPGLWSEAKRIEEKAAACRFDQASVEIVMSRGEERLVSLPFHTVGHGTAETPMPRFEWGAGAPIGRLVRVEIANGRGSILVSITAPFDASLGAYSLPVYIDGSEPCVLKVRVGAARPSIESFDPQVFIYPQGGLLRVNGGPFGPESRVFLDGVEIPYLDRSARSLHIALPEGLMPGSHRIAVACGDASTEALFAVARQVIPVDGSAAANADFSLLPEAQRMALYAGGSLDIRASVKGLKGHSASIRGLAPGLRIEPDSLPIDGDRFVDFKLFASASIAPGAYPLEIVVSGPTCEYVASLVVRVSDAAFAILPSAFADARVGEGFHASLSLFGEEGPSTDARFALAEGYLPPGLTLSDEGLLSGTFTASGCFRFVVLAIEPSGCQAKAPYEITVRDPYGLRSLEGEDKSYISASLGASARIGPSIASHIDEAPCNIKVESLELNDRIIVAYGPDGIAAFDAISLVPLWSNEYGISRIAFMSGKVLALDTQGFLRAFDERGGGILWKREGIEDFAVSGASLIAYDGNRHLVIDPADSRLLEVRSFASFKLPDRVDGARDSIGRYAIGAEGIYLVNDAAGSRSILMKGSFSCVVVQGVSLLAIESHNRLVRISGPSNAEGPRVEHVFPDIEKGGWLGVGTRVSLKALDREGLSASIELFVDGALIADTSASTLVFEPLEGTHQYLARAIDDEGVYGPPLAFQLSMDSQSPLLEARLELRPEEDGSRWVSIEASDAVSGIAGSSWTLYREGEMVGQGCAGMRFVLRDASSYRLEVYAMDRAGNEAKALFQYGLSE